MKRKMIAGFLVVAACLLGSIVSMAAEPVKPLEQRPSTSAPPAGSFQSPPPQIGKPPAGGTLGVPVVGTIRINVNQTGSAACPSSANTNIAIFDNIAGNKVKVTHNGQTTTYLPQASAITGLPLLRFDVQLCGQSNTFTYQMDGTSNILKRPLSFNISGNLDGDVTVVEFFDYRCGYCKRVAGAVTQLQQDDPNVRVVYKDYPILGEASVLAARAALASKAQGKHVAFHEALLASKNELTQETILKIATAVGLDKDRLNTDMQAPTLEAIIEGNRALARELGINGTPGFIIGTELVPGALDLKDLKNLIRQVRGKKS